MNTPCASPALESRPGAQWSPTMSLRVRLAVPLGRAGAAAAKGPWSQGWFLPVAAGSVVCSTLVSAAGPQRLCCSHSASVSSMVQRRARRTWLRPCRRGRSPPPTHAPMAGGGVRLLPLAHAGFLAHADNRGRVQGPGQYRQGRVCSGSPGLCRPAHPAVLSVDQAPQRVAETTASATVR